MTPTRRRRSAPSSGVPFSWYAIVPPSVASRPARQRSRVLFPEPFGPVTSIISPGSTVPETPRSTDSRPKRRRTWSNWSRGAFTAGNIQAVARKSPAPKGGAWVRRGFRRPGGLFFERSTRTHNVLRAGRPSAPRPSNTLAFGGDAPPPHQLGGRVTPLFL